MKYHRKNYKAFVFDIRSCHIGGQDLLGAKIVHAEISDLDDPVRMRELFEYAREGNVLYLHGSGTICIVGIFMSARFGILNAELGDVDIAYFDQADDVVETTWQNAAREYPDLIDDLLHGTVFILTDVSDDALVLFSGNAYNCVTF